MLLLSTTAAAAHFDELASLPLNTRTSVAALMSGPTFCVICAVAHSPSAAAPVVSVAPGVRYADRSVIAPIQSKSYLQVFRLDVRPPPAA